MQRSNGITTAREREAALERIEASTGRSLGGWLARVHAEGPRDRAGALRWLRDRHGLSHADAGLIAWELAPPDTATLPPAAALLEAMFAGRAELRPLYETLAAHLQALGPDVRLEPQPSYVSMARRRVFGMVRIAGEEGLELCLALGDLEPSGRFERLVGPRPDERLTLRTPVGGPEAWDASLRNWARRAYEQFG